MVLVTASRRNTFVGGTCALPSALIVSVAFIVHVLGITAYLTTIEIWVTLSSLLNILLMSKTAELWIIKNGVSLTFLIWRDCWLKSVKSVKCAMHMQSFTLFNVHFNGNRFTLLRCNTWLLRSLFYRVSAHCSRDIDIAILSVRPSVRPSVHLFVYLSVSLDAVNKNS